MSDPFEPVLECDLRLKSTYELLQSVAIFSNPYRGEMDGVYQLAGAKLTDADALLTTLNPVDPQFSIVSDFKNALIALAGDPDAGEYGYQTSALGQMNIYTEFMSGQRSRFPLAELEPTLGSVPNIALIGSVSLFSLMSLAKGMRGVRSETCQAEPDTDDPCADRNSLFGVILGALRDGLVQTLLLLQGIGDLMRIGRDLIDKIAAFTQEIYDRITQEVGRILQALFQAFHLGLAKLLNSLVGDPCLAQLLKTIGTGALQHHLAKNLGV